MTIDYQKMIQSDTPPSIQDTVTDLIGNTGWYMFGEEIRYTPEASRQLNSIDINIHRAKLINLWKKYSYYRQRKTAYNSISMGDQLDMMYWDQVNQTTHWRDWISSIKQQYPKPIEPVPTEL